MYSNVLIFTSRMKKLAASFFAKFSISRSKKSVGKKVFLTCLRIHYTPRTVIELDYLNSNISCAIRFRFHLRECDLP